MHLDQYYFNGTYEDKYTIHKWYSYLHNFYHRIFVWILNISIITKSILIIFFDMHNEACNIKSSMLRPYNGSFIEILFKYICGVRERITKKKNIFKMDTTDIHWCQIDIKNSFIWVMLFAMLCHHIYIILYYHWPHKCIHKNIRHSFNKKKFGNSYFLWILIKVYNNRLSMGIEVKYSWNYFRKELPGVLQY